jgi:hypothetical protein
MKVFPLSDTELISALVGMVAGDGNIHKQKNSPGVTLRLKHAERQKEYLEFKRDILQNLFPDWEIPIKSFDNSGYPGVKVETHDHPLLRTGYQWFYPHGKKRFSREVLNHLTPIGIAIWYMDDGSLSFKKRDGKVHAREVHLNTYCALEEVEVIRTYFNHAWDLSWTIILNKGLFRLRMGATEAMKFLRIIGPFIVPTMRYKTDLQYKYRAKQLQALGIPSL